MARTSGKGSVAMTGPNGLPERDERVPEADRVIMPSVPNASARTCRNYIAVALTIAACGILGGCDWLSGARNRYSCKENYYGGMSPAFNSEKYTSRTVVLCRSGFALLHSGLSRTPLWVAEKLTPERVIAAKNLVRVDSFHEDGSLPSGDRSSLEDYRGSGYDRGHMAPNGDMPDKSSQSDSFSLANMVPQRPENNRGIWSDIESRVRDLSAKYGEVYVVTGPIFRGVPALALGGRVMIPTDLFKAVYVPGARIAGVYVTTNDGSGNCRIIGVNDLEPNSGLSPFPGMPAELRGLPGDLPRPRSHPCPKSDANGLPQAVMQAPAASTRVSESTHILKRVVSYIFSHIR
jgi:endonuclease G